MKQPKHRFEYDAKARRKIAAMICAADDQAAGGRARAEQPEVVGNRRQRRHKLQGTGLGDKWIGGRGTLVNNNPSKPPIKTIGSCWPYATTIFLRQAGYAVQYTRVAHR